MKRLYQTITLLLMFILSITSCVTYKEITNYYILEDGSVIEFNNSPQSVKGSDAEDSLNGNEPNLSIPLP